jgi:prevent-host-death family protein
MELSIREARAQFAKAIEAAQRGERVVITRNGQPVAELGPARPRKGGVDWSALESARKRAGLDGVTIKAPPEFDDPEFSRQVLGLDP